MLKLFDMNNPPKLPLRFFRWFCHPDLLPGIEGDLLELFDESTIHHGSRKAKWKFTWDVLKLFRPSIIRPAGGTHRMNYYGLWKHHFKMARRQLFRNKAFSLISILGLGFGFAAFFVILQYVSYELSFDRFHENKNEIYRVICFPGDQPVSAGNYKGLVEHIKSNFPEVKKATQLVKYWSMDGRAVRIGKQIFYEQNVLHVSSSFFEVFPTLLKSGDPAQVLSGENSAVITEALARKYFDNENPIGQTIDFGYMGKYIISGISIDIPDNAHFKADIFVIDIPTQRNAWKIVNGIGYYSYITLDKTVSVPTLEAKLIQSIQNLKAEFPHLADDSFKLQSITDIHLHSDLTRELGSNKKGSTIYFLVVIGFLILFMAWFNYINLSTSIFFSRVHEMSIRKVIGSGKSNLISQLFSEYSYVLILAAILAILLIVTLSPFLVKAGIIPDTNQVYRYDIFRAGIFLLVVGSLLIGLYPGLLLSKFKSYSVPRGNFTRTKFGVILRSILMVFQFMASFCLIVGVVILMKQLNHIRSADRKMDVENVIAVNNPIGITDLDIRPPIKLKNYLNFKTKMVAHSAIENLTTSSDLPGSPVNVSVANLLKVDRTAPDDLRPFNIMYIDDDFFDVYKIPLLAGRSYSSNIQQDLNRGSIILSRSAIEHLGFKSPRDAINKKIHSAAEDGYHWYNYEIVGVFDNYLHTSTKTKGNPTIMLLNRKTDDIYINQYFSFTINSADQRKGAIDHLVKTWEAVWPDRDLEFYFVDELYDQQFQNEKILSSSFIFFAVIAIIISGLGLLGVTVYEIRLRTKEISIRKVMGSSTASLVRLISRKYIGLLGISIFIATPICIWLSNIWLDGYLDRIELTPLLFVPAVVLMLTIVLVSSGTSIYKAANSNPTENLRDE